MPRKANPDLYSDILKCRETMTIKQTKEALNASETVIRTVTRAYRHAVSGDADYLNLYEAKQGGIMKWARQFLPKEPTDHQASERQPEATLQAQPTISFTMREIVTLISKTDYLGGLIDGDKTISNSVKLLAIDDLKKMKALLMQKAFPEV